MTDFPTKVCKECGKDLPIGEFEPTGYRYRRSMCRKCFRGERPEKPTPPIQFDPPAPAAPIEAEDTDADAAIARDAERIVADARKARDMRVLREETNRLLEALKTSESRYDFIRTFATEETPPVHRRELASGLREATAVVLASDWHVEEEVEPEKVNGLNKYDLQIAEERINRFVDGILWLLDMHRERFQIRDMLLWLGGDFYSGFIHPELIESVLMHPTESVLWLELKLSSVITALLDSGKLERLIVCCNYGNHGRTTEKRRISTGAENSYEWLMYQFMTRRFTGDPRVTFAAPKAQFVYQQLYDYTLRFTHGDTFNYASGIGGIYVPLLRAIKRWDEARRADVTNFGHWHQRVAGKGFFGNGSLIGVTPYSIGFGIEPPQQSFYLVDSVRGPCCSTPIWVDASGHET